MSKPIDPPAVTLAQWRDPKTRNVEQHAARVARERMAEAVARRRRAVELGLLPRPRTALQFAGDVW